MIRVNDTVHQDTFSSKNSAFYKNEQKTNCSRGFKIKGDVEKRRNKENSTSSRGILEQLIPCEEKRRRLLPCNQSKNLEPVRSFSPFQNGRLSLLKHLIQERDWMCKLDLKYAYFSVPLDRNSRKFVRFQWKGALYEFMCLCFRLGPAPRVFTKLLNIPTSLLRKINNRVITYLDNVLILSHTIQEAQMS